MPPAWEASTYPMVPSPPLIAVTTPEVPWPERPSLEGQVCETGLVQAPFPALLR